MTDLDRCKAFFAEHGYIEFFDHRETGLWRRVENPSWDEDVEYRVPPAETKKPWKVGKDIFGAAHVYTGDGDRLTNSHMCRKEGWEETARLIAAAPDLLEALEALWKQALQSELNSHANEWGMEAIEMATTAIAKAKGKSQ